MLEIHFKLYTCTQAYETTTKWNKGRKKNSNYNLQSGGATTWHVCISYMSFFLNFTIKQLRKSK